MIKIVFCVLILQGDGKAWPINTNHISFFLKMKKLIKIVFSVLILQGDDKAGPEAQLKAEAGAAPGRHLHPQNLTMSKIEEKNDEIKGRYDDMIKRSFTFC